MLVSKSEAGTEADANNAARHVQNAGTKQNVQALFMDPETVSKRSMIVAIASAGRHCALPAVSSKRSLTGFGRVDAKGPDNCTGGHDDDAGGRDAGGPIVMPEARWGNPLCIWRVELVQPIYCLSAKIMNHARARPSVPSSPSSAHADAEGAGGTDGRDFGRRNHSQAHEKCVKEH